MRNLPQLTSAKYLITTVIFFVATILSAAGGGSIFDLLSKPEAAEIDAARKIILRLPMDSIYAKTNQEQGAILSFIDDTGREYRRPLKVGVRGKFRRHTCTFPPLKLNFSKKQLKADGLAKYDKLKLVTPCFDDALGQELILKEYLAYKMYEQLNPAAFRTQLLEITYRDINRQHPDQTVYAFVLEDSDELAERLGGVELENGRGLAPDRFDRRAETTQALFSFFIGNHDWNLAMARNLKMVELPNGQIIPVPYDFDFSALVGAPYRRLNSAVGQVRADQRIYLGLFCSDKLLEEAFTIFEAKRKSLNKMIRNFDLIPYEKRTEMINSLSSFYFDFRQLQRKEPEAKSAFSTTNSLYYRLRAEQLNIIPAGAKPEYYGVAK